MPRALASFRSRRGRLAGRFAGLMLSALFLLGSAFPQFQALLPHDPLTRRPTAPVRAQPVLWFPLAYTLSGLPAAAWPPGAGSHLTSQVPVNDYAYIPAPLWNDPALPAAVIQWLAPLALLAWLHLTRGRRPGVPDLSALDPPPRLAPALS